MTVSLGCQDQVVTHGGRCRVLDGELKIAASPRMCVMLTKGLREA